MNIHRYTAPYRPELHDPADTRHFDSDIPPEVRAPKSSWLFCETEMILPVPQPLAPANGAPADATKDPLLRDRVHGLEILNVRKALAFAGFTHKSPRAISYVKADKAFDPQPDTYGQEQPATRGRATVRSIGDFGKGRAISM